MDAQTFPENKFTKAYLTYKSQLDFTIDMNYLLWKAHLPVRRIQKSLLIVVRNWLLVAETSSVGPPASWDAANIGCWGSKTS